MKKTQIVSTNTVQRLASETGDSWKHA